jgi:hypothetical protein
MSRKDVTDRAVCLAYAERNADGLNPGPHIYERLAASTGQCEKVCYRAMERACDHGLIEYGVSLRSGWLTDAGKALCTPEQK